MLLKFLSIFGISLLYVCPLLADDIGGDSAKTGPIYYATCGDWAFSIEDETANDITVKYSAKGPDEEPYHASVPKVLESDNIKIYLNDNTQDIFINDNGTWGSRGHICSGMRPADLLIYRCPNNFERAVRIVGYKHYSKPVVNDDLLLVYTIKYKDLIDRKVINKKPVVLLKNKDIKSVDAFINNDIKINIERTKNAWIIDNKLCE